MKKKLMLILSVLMLSGLSAKAMRDIPLDIAVNDHIIYTDAEAFIENGTTFVPVRFVSEALWCDTVEWDQDKQSVTIRQGDKTILLTVGSDQAVVNGVKKKIPAKAMIRNDRTYLPVRWISEQLGAEVHWLDDYYMVDIRKAGVTPPKENISNEYTKDEIFWLGRIIHAESSGESMDGKIGVGNVILNRVESKEYPNTIYNVIFDKKYGVQFQPIMNGAIYNNPAKDSMRAAKLALSGYNTAGDSLYFLNPRIATNFWIINNRTYHKTIGNHDFYL